MMDDFDQQINEYAKNNQYGVSPIPSHAHNGTDSQQIDPVNLLGFPTISVASATTAPTDTPVNGTIRFYYDGTNYIEWVRINNTWKSFLSFTIGQIPGTTTNDNASAGNVGEYKSTSLGSGSAVALTTNTAANVASVSLTAGDWDVTGVVNFSTSGASASDFKSGSNSTSATFGGENTYVNIPLIATGLSDVLSEIIPTRRYSLLNTTLVYIIAYSTFTVGSVSAYGEIRARRIR